MTENKQFKDALINYNEAVQNLIEAKKSFKAAVVAFMKEKGIPVRVEFFGDTFGVDIRCRAMRDTPLKIPLDVLTDFCKEFGCEYEYTNCDGKRYLFSFNKLDMRF